MEEKGCFKFIVIAIVAVVLTCLAYFGINMYMDKKRAGQVVMSITLEVPVQNVLRELSDNSKDETFNKALKQAEAEQNSSEKDFLTLFYNAYRSIDPEAKLGYVFNTFELREEITPELTNDEVMKVLQAKTDDAIDNSINVLKFRISNFGISKATIQRTVPNIIKLEIPGVENPERVRRLLEGAGLGFYETYNIEEIASELMTANDLIKEIFPSDESEEEETNMLDSLLALDEETMYMSDSDMKNIKKDYPLFSVLQTDQAYGPTIGYAKVADTAIINQYFASEQIKELFPDDMQVKWALKPSDNEGLHHALIAIKTTYTGKAQLDGRYITDARVDDSNGFMAVSMRMDTEGAKIWEKLTRKNIGRTIAIVVDDQVYSYPMVNMEITGGRSQISGNFTLEEAKDLATILKSGAMPVKLKIVEENIIEPEK